MNSFNVPLEIKYSFWIPMLLNFHRPSAMTVTWKNSALLMSHKCVYPKRPSFSSWITARSSQKHGSCPSGSKWTLWKVRGHFMRPEYCNPVNSVSRWMLWLLSGSSQSKTAYIDPPLLKTEMSWRERSLLFHEESVKLAFKKTVSRPIFFLTSEELSLEMNPPEVRSIHWIQCK